LNENDQSPVANPSSSTSSEKWVTVAPKKRGRAFQSGKKRTVGPTPVSPAPPTVKVVNHLASAPATATHPSTAPTSPAPLIIPPTRAVGIQPVTNAEIQPPVDGYDASRPSTTLLGPTGAHGRVPTLEPASSEVSGHAPSGTRVNASTPTSPFEGSDVEEDDVTMFLNLEAEEDIQLSSESSKKRRLEEGEASSPSHSLN